MLNFLPAPLLLLINLAWCLSVTALLAGLIVLLGLFKLLLPLPAMQISATRLGNGLMRLWVESNRLIFSLTNRIDWQITDCSQQPLRKGGWYLLISNHLSWADIVVITQVFRNRIPMGKFFLKQQLLYMPLIGQAAWALDMPFMKRHSRQTLLRHPHLRNQDLDSARRACDKFRRVPTTVINFAEGTRYTPAKREQQGSPYRQLLPPKPAGIAYTLSAMGDRFDALIDVTLSYPDNPGRPFIDLLCGRLRRVVMQIDTLAMDDNLRGDYFHDKAYKQQFQHWLRQRWQQKDQRLSQLDSPQRPDWPQ